jgi:hypothetical protein
VSEREREGEDWPCGTDGLKEGARPCGEHGPHAGEASGELGCGLEERRGERGLGFGGFLFFSNL